MEFMTHLACLEDVGDDLDVWTTGVARNRGVVAWVTTNDFASCFITSFFNLDRTPRHLYICIIILGRCSKKGLSNGWCFI